MRLINRKLLLFVRRRSSINLMPYRLTNAPLTFERLRETVLAGLQYNICLVYLDDIFVYGADFDEEFPD